MNNIKKNISYSIFYQILNIFLPLITIPYISRTLGVYNNGIYSYTFSIVNYFMIFSMLGINNYGNRKIAKSRDNKTQMSKEFWGIYGLQFILSFVSLFIYVLYTFCFAKYKYVAFIETIYLISVMLDISWFYFGIENFKTTVIRNSIVKIFSLIMIILFVNSKNDLIIYTLIMSLSTALSQLVLWKGLFSKVCLKKEYLCFKNVFKNFKGVLILFVPVISYSIYKLMDKIMIGLLFNVNEVAYYEYAEKIINIPICFITAIGAVMMPKMSNLVENNSNELIKKYIIKTLNIIMFITIPCCIGLIIIGNDFSVIFLGNDYSRTGQIIMLLAITINFTAWANVIRTQWLIPKEKDKIYVFSTLFGAVINFIVNILMIPNFGGIGAAIGTIISEAYIMIYQTIKSSKELGLIILKKDIIRYIVSSIIMGFSIIIVGGFIKISILKLCIQVIIGVIIYGILNYKQILKSKKGVLHE